MSGDVMEDCAESGFAPDAISRDETAKRVAATATTARGMGETDAWREFSGVESLAPKTAKRANLTKFAVSCIINDWFRDGLHRGNAVRARLSWRLLPLLL